MKTADRGHAEGDSDSFVLTVFGEFSSRAKDIKEESDSHEETKHKVAGMISLDSHSSHNSH